MLLDMLASDAAAAKHGLDYAPPHPDAPPRSNSPYLCALAQSPLSLLSSIRRSTDIAAPVLSSTLPPASPADTSSSNNHNLMTDPDSAAPHPSTQSRPASSSSLELSQGKPKKRAPRPKTTFTLAQPPPTKGGSRQKLHLRPKVLLQLQQVIPSHRPKPVYEVIPFSILAPRSTRRFARQFSKDKLCPSDVLVVKAEEYGARDDDERSDEERWGARDIVGVICPGKKDDKEGNVRSEVLMDNGISWEAMRLPNGGYEFNHVDDHGLPLKCRWIPKPAHSRRVSTMSNASLQGGLPAEEENKFNFSTISPNSRRHPIIATMTKASIDVLDSYQIPSATSPPTPGFGSPLMTPLPTPATLTDPSSFLDSVNDRLPVKTDDALRRFIVVSGIWVSFCENWSPAYTLSKTAPSPLATPGSLSRAPVPNRTVSMSFVDTSRSASPASIKDENGHSIPKAIRRGTQMLHRKASYTSQPSPVSAKSSPVSSPIITRARRSNSTGTADLRSRNGSTRKRFSRAFEDQAPLETEEDRQSKRSAELLRIKELVIPDTQPASSRTSSHPSSPVLPTPPVQILEPSPVIDRMPSVDFPNMTASPNLGETSKAAKRSSAQSAYTPIATAGLWDSGVEQGKGLKTRPTSLVVVNERKQKEKKKRDRSKSKEKRKEDKGDRRKSDWFKHHFIDIFRRDKVH